MKTTHLRPHFLLVPFIFLASPSAWSINPEGSSCSSTCSTCGCGNSGTDTGHTSPPANTSFDWSINLGLARYPKPATFTDLAKAAYEPDGNTPTFAEMKGRYFPSSPYQQAQIPMKIVEPKISAATFHPSCLFIQSEALFEKLTKPAAGGNPEYIHQVLTDDAFTLVELLTTPDVGFRIRIWKRNAAGAMPDKIGGYYPTTGFDAKTPLTDVTFKRGADNNNLLNINLLYTQTEASGSNGANTITNEIVQTLNSSTQKPSSLVSKTYKGAGTTGGLLHQENLTFGTVGSSDREWDYVITREEMTAPLQANGTTQTPVSSRKTRETYHDLSPGSSGGAKGMKRLAKRELLNFAGTAVETTDYEYYNLPTDPVIHGRLKSVTHADGSWRYFEYTSGTVPTITEYASWKDVTMANKAQARITVTEVQATEVETTHYVGSQFVGKSRTHLNPVLGQITSEQWDGSAYHITTTCYFADGDTNKAQAGRIHWIEKSDGTAAVYTYDGDSSGTLDWVSVDEGAGSASEITSGTRTKTYFGLGNIAIAQETSDFRDISTSIQTEAWAVDPSYSSATGGCDAIGRPIKRIFNNNSDDYDITEYTCCGLAKFRGRDGSVTEYFRDHLKRVYKTTYKATPAADAPLVETLTSITIPSPDYETTTSRSRKIGSSELFLGSSSISFDRLTTKSVSPSQKSTNPDDRPTTTSVRSHTSTGDTITTTDALGGTSITTHYRDGQVKGVSGSAVADADYDYGAHDLKADGTTPAGSGAGSETGGGLYTTMTSIDPAAPAVSLTSTSYSDLLGRTLKSVTPQNGTTLYAYHATTATAGNRGKLASTKDADNVTTSYGYNDKGEQTTTSRTVPVGTGTATMVTTTTRDVVNFAASGAGTTNEKFHGAYLGPCFRTTQKVESTDVAIITTAESVSTIDGLSSASRSFGRETLTVSTRPDATTGVATRTSIAPDGTRTVTTFKNGLTKTVEYLPTTGTTAIASTNYTYDALQRPLTVVDSRNNNTTSYRAAGTDTADVTESGRPLTMTNSHGKVTEYTYDLLGRLTQTNAPDSTLAGGGTSDNITESRYYLTGQLKAQWGDQTYATFYKYNEQNRMTELRTYRSLTHNTEPTDATTGDDSTTWLYDNTTGLLSGKRDADSKGADYSYTNAGRLRTRKWARTNNPTDLKFYWTRYDYAYGFLTTTRHYLNTTTKAADITALSIPGDDPDTPDSDFTYDRLGRLDTAARFRVVGNTRSEFTKNQLHYTTNFTVDEEDITVDPDGSGSIPALTRKLDRKEEPASPRRSTGWDLKNGASVEHTNTYGYHATQGRLETVTGSTTDTFTYGYEPDSAYLVKTVTAPGLPLTVTNVWLPDRDVLDEKTNVIEGELFSKYDYHQNIDHSVNDLNQRTEVTTSGSAFGGATQLVEWGYDALGQVVKADHPTAAKDFGYSYDQMGNRKRSSRNTTDTGTTTAANLAVYRPTSGGSGEGGNSLNQYKTLELYGAAAEDNTYDDDGNQINGRFATAAMATGSRTWDGENQLIQTAVTGGATTTYTYDAFHRRVAKRTGTTNVEITVYDGWNPIAEYSIPTSSYVLQTSYTWGLDLSGRMQGAGGVGGLLALKLHTGSTQGVFWVTYDGNGNVSEYINNSQIVAAHYEYGPFGETTAATGSAPTIFKHRFSTKPLDAETGYYYYGYRSYDPLSGRWLGRDPIGEQGGVNLYGFVGNDVVGRVDVLGREVYEFKVKQYLGPHYIDAAVNNLEDIMSWTYHRWIAAEGEVDISCVCDKIDKIYKVDYKNPVFHSIYAISQHSINYAPCGKNAGYKPEGHEVQVIDGGSYLVSKPEEHSLVEPPAGAIGISLGIKNVISLSADFDISVIPEITHAHAPGENNCRILIIKVTSNKVVSGGLYLGRKGKLTQIKTPLDRELTFDEKQHGEIKVKLCCDGNGKVSILNAGTE